MFAFVAGAWLDSTTAMHAAETMNCRAAQEGAKLKEASWEKERED